MRHINNRYNDLRWRHSVDALNCTRPDAVIEWRPKLKVWDAWVFRGPKYPIAARYANAQKLRTDTLLEACAFVLSRSIRDDIIT